MPFSSPPPRYVSVIGLNEQPAPKKGSNAPKSRRQTTLTQSNTTVPKAASNSNTNCAAEELEGGLPTYDEALEQQDSIATVCEEGGSGSSNTVMRVSMV